MSTRDIYPIYFFLPDLFGPDRTTIIGKAVTLARAAGDVGLDVGVIFDYFVKDPYHGRPPHVEEDGYVSSNVKKRNAGKGYYPYSWRPGWTEAVNAISSVLDAVKPEFIQQGINSDDINWKTALEPSLLYRGYNDTMGLFNQATDASQWHGTYVVSGFFNRSLPKARERFGSAITDDDFLQRCTLELPDGGDGETPPPTPSNLEDRVLFLENTMKSVLITFARIQDAIQEWGS